MNDRCKNCANILYSYDGLMNFNRDAGCMDCVESGGGRTHFKDREKLSYQDRVKTLFRLGLVSVQDISVLHSCDRLSANDCRYVLDLDIPKISEESLTKCDKQKPKLEMPRDRCEHFGTVNGDCSQCPEDLNLACIDVAAMIEEQACPGCSDRNLEMWVIQSKENQILKQILRDKGIDYLNWKCVDHTEESDEQERVASDKVFHHKVPKGSVPQPEFPKKDTNLGKGNEIELMKKILMYAQNIRICQNSYCSTEALDNDWKEFNNAHEELYKRINYEHLYPTLSDEMKEKFRKMYWPDDSQSKEEEIEVLNLLLDERNRILDALPCPDHGRCVPHVLEFIKKHKPEESKLSDKQKRCQDNCSDYATDKCRDCEDSPDSNTIVLGDFLADARKRMIASGMIADNSGMCSELLKSLLSMDDDDLKDASIYVCDAETHYDDFGLVATDCYGRDDVRTSLKMLKSESKNLNTGDLKIILFNVKED